MQRYEIHYLDVSIMKWKEFFLIIYLYTSWKIKLKNRVERNENISRFLSYKIIKVINTVCIYVTQT
jgi:hypothetical protein